MRAADWLCAHTCEVMGLIPNTNARGGPTGPWGHCVLLKQQVLAVKPPWWSLGYMETKQLEAAALMTMAERLLH